MLEIRTLGGLTIRCEGKALAGFASRKVEALLVYLACAARPKARESLAELLWEERTQTQSLSNLRVALSSLRKQVAPYLLIGRETIGLNPETEVWLDTARLETELATLHDRSGPLAPAALTELKRVVALYRGDFLEGFYLRDCSGFENWMVLERERIRAVHEQLAQGLVDVLLAGECWPEVVECGERWISLGQTPEPAYRAVMQAYAGLGDLAAVQAAYRRCAEALATELEVEPSQQSRDLYRDLLQGQWRPQPPATPAVILPTPAADASARELLRRWPERGGEVLDLPSLAVVYASRADLGLGPEEAGLLIRSALHHGVDVEPWLRRAGSPQAAVQALAESWERYPKPRVRSQIVDALARLPADDTASALMRIVAEDDAPDIRTQAALLVAERGRRDQVVEVLLTDLGTPREAGAMAALVAVADVHGLDGAQAACRCPRLPLAAAVARRRWLARRGEVLGQAGRAALGAGLGWALFGLTTPLYTALALPAEFRKMTEQFLSVPAWMLTAALTALVVGVLLGWVLAAAVGVADALLPCLPRWRLALGSLAGLVYSAYLGLFTLAGAYVPSATPGTCLAVYAGYGLLQGAIVSYAIPALGARVPFRYQLLRSVTAGLAGAAITVPYVYLLYPGESVVTLFSRLLNAFLLVAGLGLALGSVKHAARPAPAVGAVRQGQPSQG